MFIVVVCVLLYYELIVSIKMNPNQIHPCAKVRIISCNKWKSTEMLTEIICNELLCAYSSLNQSIIECNFCVNKRTWINFHLGDVRNKTIIEKSSYRTGLEASEVLNRNEVFFLDFSFKKKDFYSRFILPMNLSLFVELLRSQAWDGLLHSLSLSLLIIVTIFNLMICNTRMT